VSVRLLVDEMYPRSLAERLRSHGVDAVATLEVPGLPGAPDPAVLSWAHAAGRAVVTENIGDYTRLSVSQEHSGIVLLSAKNWTRAGGGVARIAAALVALDSSGHDQLRVHWLRPEAVPGP